MNTPFHLMSILLIFLCGGFWPSDSMAESLQVTAASIEGVVKDQSGVPLIGVNIQIKGTSKGTATDFDGHFTLEDVDENAILVISYVGYQTQEISVDGKSKLEIILTSDSQMLDEVVVTALGIRDRKSTRLNSSHVAISYA